MDDNNDSYAYGSGGGDNGAEGEEEYEECEVEDLVDDAPMHVSGRLFLGSIDAARNAAALAKARIAFTLALLGSDDHGDGVAAAPSGLASAAQQLPVGDDGAAAEAEADGVTRTEVEVEDALDEDLFRKLPGILATLKSIIEQAERVDRNMLVHCVAGRSRSPSVIAAWLITQSPADKYSGAEQVIEEISFIRPWIEINAHFQRELQLFHRVMTVPSELQQHEVQALVSRKQRLPRVDFGESLVADVLAGKKTITMRLESDLEGDANSDLKDVFQHATVVATTSATALTRQPFAVLRVHQVETKCLHELDTLNLQKSGFASIPQVLVVLRQFYPHVTETTPLLMVHFECLGQVAVVSS